MGEDYRGIHTHLFDTNEPALEGISPHPLLTAQYLDDPQRMASLVFPGENDYGQLFAYFEQQHRPAPYPWACFSTANASVPREAIERVGGLDTYFSGWGLEDTDLAYRLYQAGLPFRYAPKAITLRQLRPGKHGQPRDLTQNLAHFLGKYPAMTSMERKILQHGRYAVVD